MYTSILSIQLFPHLLLPDSYKSCSIGYIFKNSRSFLSVSLISSSEQFAPFSGDSPQISKQQAPALLRQKSSLQTPTSMRGFSLSRSNNALYLILNLKAQFN
ncbi:hypothetical protein FGO68_gene11378 [Halteria grandinella]|uniref:Uncharacterized protein n=1 Tax=Halteria grandinella TaxID=5974 RepID=A0A8J8T201_HALGN|nr:hypothetical protein FGO68_gene11378 [Halteria grandinella]